MRLIDGDKLKRKVQRIATEAWMMKLTASVETTLNQFIDYIDEAPTIDKPQWIPCSERLPARQGYYICACKDGSRVLKTTTIKWSNGWQLSGTRAYWKVIAWMPLPEPYRESEDE